MRTALLYVVITTKVKDVGTMQLQLYSILKFIIADNITFDIL